MLLDDWLMVVFLAWVFTLMAYTAITGIRQDRRERRQRMQDDATRR